MITIEENRNFFGNFNPQDQKFYKKNASTFAYEILYNKPATNIITPPFPRHSTKNIGGIDVDAGIPTVAIKDLNKIKNIQIRATCQGSDSNHPTYVIFRTENQTEPFVNDVVRYINNVAPFKAKAEKGNNGYFRIGVTAMSWYGRKNFQKFWELISQTIDNAVNRKSNKAKQDSDNDERMQPVEMKSKLPTDRITRNNQTTSDSDLTFQMGGGQGRGNFPRGRGQGMGGNRRNRF